MHLTEVTEKRKEFKMKKFNQNQIKFAMVVGLSCMGLFALADNKTTFRDPMGRAQRTRQDSRQPQ